MLQRFYRRNDAARYVGMSTYLFDELVRPYLTAIPISRQGIAFDRVELDAWAEHHKSANGRPSERRKIWDANEYPVSENEAKFGGLTRKSKDIGFEKALAHVTSGKRSNI
jgi:hypothetical protein